MTFSVAGQDIDARSPKPAPSGVQQRKADKKKEKQRKKIEKGNEKGRQKHIKLQSKNTRKMMRKSKHTSSQWNDNRKEFFLKRWFRKKHH